MSSTVDTFTSGSWVGHPDPQVDGGVMPLDPLLTRMLEIGKPPFFRAIPVESFATAELHDQLDALPEVIFFGYPKGLFDSKNLLPITRTGRTATPIAIDYQGQAKFLIDASVFPGSSGSPVVLLEDGMYKNRSGPRL